MKKNLPLAASGLLFASALLPILALAQPGSGGAVPTYVVSNNQNVSGPAASIIVQNGGRVTITGATSVDAVLRVEAGGVLITNCQAITGTGTFTLQAGGELQICDANGITSSGATGAIRLTGARSYSAGADYTYNGTVAQTTGNGLPTTVRSLTKAGSSAAVLSLSQPLSVSQVLRLTNGNVNTNGQALTLLSNASGTALVDNTGGTVSGAATVQRYIDPSLNAGNGYRHYAAPVSNTTVADLLTSGFSPVAPGAAYNSSTSPGTVSPFPNVYSYDESRVLTSPATTLSPFDKGWTSPNGMTAPLVVGQGYTVNIAASQNVDFVGTLNSGTINLSLPRAGGADGGWQLLGNPYPSPLDWGTMSGNLTNMDAAMYVYQSSGPYAGQYRSYVSGIGNPLIASGQGFFVRTSTPGVTGTVSLTNANRITNPATTTAFQRGSADTRPQVELTLQGLGSSDAATVYFQAGTTAGFDAAYDACKLPNTGTVSLALALPAGELLAVNGLPALPTGLTVLPLAVAVPAAGSCTLAATALANVPAATAVYLHDAATNALINLRQQPRYTFQATANMTGRFSLHFDAARPTGTRASLGTNDISLYPNPARANVRVAVAGQRLLACEVLNALGQPLSITATADAAGTVLLPTASLSAGIYLVRVSTAEGSATRRLVVE